jgi:predicted RNA-binding protein YlxR (DUF448 family)
MLRVVGRGNDVLPDPQARLPGRGASVHPSQTCFEQAKRRRAFTRALRLQGAALTAALEQYLAQLCEESGQDRPGQPGRRETALQPGKQDPIVMSAR